MSDRRRQTQDMQQPADRPSRRRGRRAAESVAAPPTITALPAPQPAFEPEATPIPGSVEDLLARSRAGDPAAAEALFVSLYETLKSYARAEMHRRRSDHTLQPTALVNEVYLRLVRHGGGWEGRSHFLGVAAKAMRSVLVDYARRRTRRKRTTPGSRLPDEFLDACEAKGTNMPDLDDALVRLRAQDPVAERIVEMRYFAGLALPAVAETLDVPLRTVERKWQWARAWLRAELE